jgi:hypothetical protein
MLTHVTLFTPYPFAIGEKIHISSGPRHGDWIVVSLDERKITLRCPVSGKEVYWDRFCYLTEQKEQEWPPDMKTP